jgi:hypothetical protein
VGRKHSLHVIKYFQRLNRLQNIRASPSQLNSFSTKATNYLGALLDVEMSKKCAAVWREAHLDVKSVKN